MGASSPWIYAEAIRLFYEIQYTVQFPLSQEQCIDNLNVKTGTRRGDGEWGEQCDAGSEGRGDGRNRSERWWVHWTGVESARPDVWWTT